MTNLYDFTVKTQEGQDFPLANYKGKLVLVVNTATKCGLTPQYQALQELYDAYHAKGFEILDFPCNQFLNQAPGDAQEINQFCSLTYHTTFPRFAKVNVNGKDAEPLFTWLKEEKSGPLGKAIEWNFAKFLISPDGQVIERYSAKSDPKVIEQQLKVFLD
ncbi:glutathione peroxidase [Streptococcus halichoeri]|uniref:glutathione peroxidase n=1 Tax=Streptococcus halichoeri TaxID=254785 RepID=UPI0013574E2B|nr:glutathione peroxidase [Streptococcus halichoeri]